MARARALKVLQNADTPLYLFTLAAEEVDLVADVARIGRDEAGKLIGYQRPEKRKHVKQIQDYLDSADVLFPNGLILALPPRCGSSPAVVRRQRWPRHLGNAGDPARQRRRRAPPSVDRRRPAAEPGAVADQEPPSPRPDRGFVDRCLELQREQFLRVNTVQPLPVNLVTELLPEITRVPSGRMSTRQLPSALVDMLNHDRESPFFELVKRASSESGDEEARRRDGHRTRGGLKESLESPSGVLFPYRNIATGTTDTEGIRKVLITYWTAVRNTFPEAWGLPPTQSRLMGGVGIRAMGRLMERVMAHVDVRRRRRGSLRLKPNWQSSPQIAAGPRASGPNSGCPGTNSRTRLGTSAPSRTSWRGATSPIGRRRSEVLLP